MDLGLERFQDALKLKRIDNKTYIWCAVRKKWLVLQPEEMVRQLLLVYLVQEAGFKKNRIAVERGLKVNEMQKRCDILVYDDKMQPYLLIECKRAKVALTQAVFRQVANYNIALKVPYLLVCNGPDTYCCSIDFEEKSFDFMDALP